MEQEPESSNIPLEAVNNASCMTVLNAKIDESSFDITSLKKFYESNKLNTAKLEMQAFEKNKGAINYIYETLFDKIILSILGKQKMMKKDHLFLFYFFFKKEYYKHFQRLNYANTGKFLKKFFNRCIKSVGKYKFFTNEELIEFINFYMTELYSIIGKDKNVKRVQTAKDIQDLKNKQIKKLDELDLKDWKFVKNLVKYILAFCDLLEVKKSYVKYHWPIFTTFYEIRDAKFKNYFQKQLYKICLKKGIYKYGSYLLQYIFFPFLFKNHKISKYQITEGDYNLLAIILSYIPEKLIEKEEDKKTKYKSGSPFYLLNTTILLKIMNDLLINEKMKKFLLYKIANSFNQKINLFVDDGNKLRIAEFLLTDTTDNKKIMKNFDKMILIKPFIKNIDTLNNNKDFWQYFEYLFFYLSADIYIKEQSLPTNKAPNKQNLDLSYFYIKSQDPNNTSDFIDLNSDILEKEKKDNKKIIISKFQKSNDRFIQRYFNHDYPESMDESDLETILAQKNIETLFLLLDISYYISIKIRDEKIIKRSVEDIKKIISLIIVKSYENNKKTFNCTILDFILKVDLKYLPSPDYFDIIKSICHTVLTKDEQKFFISYPISIIYLLNFCPINNYDAQDFLLKIKQFIQGYSNEITFKKLDESYGHTIQINYLFVVNFIFEQIIIINRGNISKEDENENTIRHLPYCPNCSKKFTNPIICSEFLSKCPYCYENCLYINTNLYNYFKRNKCNLKEFLNETIHSISNITLNILKKFDEIKEREKEKEKIDVYSYNLFFKLMKNQFQFLNDFQPILGKNILRLDEKYTIGKKVETLGELINNSFNFLEEQEDEDTLNIVFKYIQKDVFNSFDSYRKSIKHKTVLAELKYEEKNKI